MSDKIDIPVEASGDDGINRVTSAIDRLHESMVRLGENSAVGRLAQQMELMQASMSTGFANLSASMEKMVGSFGDRQARAIEESGDKAAKALTEAGLKIKTADARTWEQIGRGSAANITAAFYQLEKGIPVETVKARFGEMALATAQSLDGQLEKLKQFQANAKSVYQTAYRPMVGATEHEIDQARAMNSAWTASMRTKSASNIDARTLLGMPSEAESRSIGQQIAAQIRAGVAAEKAAASVDVRTLLGAPAEAEMRGFATQLAVSMRTAVEQETLRARSASSVTPSTLLGLPSREEMRTAGQQIAAQMREAVTAENLRAKSASTIDARTLLGLPSESESRTIGQQLAAQIRAGVAAEKAAPSVDPRALLGLPAETEMRGFASQLAVSMRTAVEQETLRARSATNISPNTLLGLPSREEARTAGQQIAAQMREAVTAENLRAKSASSIDARTILGLPSEAETRTIGQQIAAQMRAAVATEGLRAKSASNVDARALLGLPAESEMRSFSQQLRAQMKEMAEFEVAADHARDRQRLLNATFTTATPARQIRMAELAQTYAGLAGDERAKSRFGGLAVSADIDALRAAHQTLTPAVRSSAAAVAEHGNAMAEAHSLARGLAGSLGGLWLTYGSLIPLAAGAAIAASLKNVVTVGAEVEHQLTNVLALTKSSVNLDQFLSVSDGSLRSLTEGANAMRMLAQNGLNAGQSLQILPAILDLATVGEMNVGQAALAATGAASAFGLSYSEAGRIADIFAVTAANSNTSVLAMTESMKQASTVASLFKVSIEETAAMLGLLAKINVTGGAAGTSMTNMLTGLYEPTQKGKKALKELGIETQMASGALKPLTQLLEEMRGALSGFSDSARVDLLGSIFTVRGVKSAQLALDNIDDFKKKTEEAANASGFMAGVVKKLEDDTTGGFERLGVVVQNSFVRSFQEASPFVQHIALTLSDMFKDGGAASNGLRNFSTNIARVTGALAENLDAVTLLAGGYVAMRALGPVTGLVLEAISASVAHTTAVAAETAAMAAVTTANLGAGASAELVTAAVTAQATATEAAALAAAKLDAALLPVLGAVGIAVGVAAAAWLLFRDNTSEADRANQQIENSLSVVSEALEREIKQLEKSNSLWNEREGRYNAPETSVESDVKKAESAVTRLETEARNKAGRLNIDPEQYLKSLRSGQAFGSDQLAAQLRQADSNLAQWREKARITEEDLIPKKAIKGVHDATEQLNKELEAFYNQGMGSNSKGEFYQQNAAVRAVHQQALSLASQLTDAPKGATPEAEMARIAAIKTDLKQLQDQSNALRNSHADTGDKDAARTRIEQLQEELRLKQMLAKSEIDTAKGQNKRGELGDLQLINYELVKKLEVDQKAVEVARAQLAAAGPLKGSQQQRYQNAVTTAEAQMGVDRAAAERQKQDVLDQMAGKELEARAKALESQGRLQDAFNITWEAKHANVLANLSRDIADAQNADYRDALVRYQNYLGEQRRLGQNDARFKEGQNAFGAADATLRAKLEDARNQAGPGSGLYSTLNSSVLEQGAYGDMIPQLQAAQAKVAASSSKLFGGDDAKLKVAQDELRKIQSAMAAMRNTAVDMGEAIARALTDAFGKGGAAMGSMIVAATNYGVKMQEIDATLAASKGTEADRAQAAAATASAQIKGYGDMAGAAKGFFDQNSNGYRILHTTEQAFRAFELAQAAMALGKKLFFKQTEVAATTALNGTKVAGEAASTAASTALAGTEASAWGITAVAKAIASLPFPFNLAAGAATMAAIVGLGIKMTGGFGGGSSAADRQAENGTGTIAGDPKAKTESLAKSLALVEKNTYNGLAVSYDMLHTLQAINSNISGFAGLILQNTDIANPDVRLSSGIGKTGWAQADLTATGAEIGLAVGGLAGAAVGAALGYVASKIPAVQKLYSSIFGGKQSLDDTGFMMSKTSLGDIASRGVNAQTYADITTSGGWFRSDKHNTQSNSAGDEANRAISQILLGMGDAVKSAGAILGLSGSEFDAKLNSFVVDIGKISLKGLSSSEQQAAIQSAFSKVGDQMAQSAVSTITQFSKAGEGALETLVRVATDYQAVDAVFASFGTTFAEVGVSSIAAREKLIDLAGGLDKFTSNAEFFFKNFLTEAQQTAANRAAITPTLGKYGLSTEGADAVKKFADLTIAMGAMGAAGAEAYTELMRIAPAFKAVTDVAKDLQDQIDDLMMTQAQKDAAARAALDPANRALFDQLQQAKAISQARSTLASSYQSEASSLQSAIDKLKSFSVSLKNFINTLQLSDASPLNPADKYGAALSLFNTTLAKAQAGDADAQGNLQSVMQSFLQASKAANASNSTYQSDYNRVTAAAAAMAATADKQATEGQTNLAALRQQISQLTTLNETSLSIVEAINNLAVAMTGGKDDKVNATAVESLYQELLGRSSDAGGAAFYTNLLKQGVSLSTVIEDIKSSSEYLTHIGQVPATTNVTPSTQYGTAPGTPSGGASVDIAGLYRQVLGRAPDQAGLDYWTGVAKSGASMENIKAAMMGGTEYQQSHVAPAVATDPYSGIAAQNTQIVAQLAKVNDHLDSLRTEQQQQADNQTAATFAAAAGTGEDVADALKETTREARWTNSNKLDLR